ncbi:hypothetical protein HMPREF0542_11975 [Ligilactobacillus ruminis ATCC 25644]|uniref:Uncharacterized protein n=1 Tax=Ligilactobacillus ruminis ATCC 25644 TaxID=525362 RepID=E7FSU8_9LACO|nr:hypothetical protein HMPREF0542_11975 [Ligilactobacillus ruminis ATCC 25644]EGX99264.1 hypothetical protein ANHS_179 [Ligilactobacillus ruminis ATCC 25644]
MQSSFVFLMIHPGKCREDAAAYVLMDLSVRGSLVFTGRFEKTEICP